MMLSRKRLLVQAIYIYASAAVTVAAAFVPHSANVNVNPFLRNIHASPSTSGSGSTFSSSDRKHQMTMYSSYDKNNNNNNNLDDYSGFFDDEFNRITGSSNSNSSNNNSENFGDDYSYSPNQNKRNRDREHERDIQYKFILDIDNDIKPDEVYIILFNPDTDREGVHTIEFPKESGNNMILAFESHLECQQFSASLKEQQFFDPTPQQMNLEALENYCVQIGVEVQVIPKGMGMNLTPPKESVLNLGLNPNLEQEMKMLDYLFEISSSEDEDDDDYIGEWE